MSLLILFRVYTDGSILLSHGGIEMGQGLHTKMIQVAAKVLKVNMKKIHIIDTSTETIANSTATGIRDRSLLLGRQTSKCSSWDVVLHENDSKLSFTYNYLKMVNSSWSHL